MDYYADQVKQNETLYKAYTTRPDVQDQKLQSTSLRLYKMSSTIEIIVVLGSQFVGDFPKVPIINRRTLYMHSIEASRLGRTRLSSSPHYLKF